MKWVDAFLCLRQQRVVVNGVKSSPTTKAGYCIKI